MANPDKEDLSMSDESKNESKGILRFDVYDVFGYIIPGGTFIAGIYAHMRLFSVTCIQDMVSQVLPHLGSSGSNPSQSPPSSWPSFLSMATAFLFLTYITGHLVASFSSVIMSKWVTERVLGFPHMRLFKDVLKPSDYEKRKTYFHKTLLTIFLTLLLVLTVFGRVDRILVYLVGSYVLLAIVKIIFTTLSLPDIQAPETELPEDSLRRKIGNWFWTWTIRWWMYPLTWLFFDSWTSLLLSLFRMRKPFTVEFQKRFEKNFEEVFDMKIDEAGSDVFWLPFCYVSEKCTASAKLITQWLRLYGFARNLAISLFLLFIYGVVMHRFCPAGKYQAEKNEYLFWCLITGICAVIFGVRYYYLHYNYFSKFVFRIFVSAQAYEKPDQSPPSERVEKPDQPAAEQTV